MRWLISLALLIVATSGHLHRRDAPPGFSKPASRAVDYIDPYAMLLESRQARDFRTDLKASLYDSGGKIAQKHPLSPSSFFDPPQHTDTGMLSKKKSRIPAMHLDLDEGRQSASASRNQNPRFIFAFYAQ
ncbi:hypothetical protein C8Q80DRAFT_607158 [Daedaleopsis nitida]|nr:hypothetical protein C8Q80DRAFT_607158 [Daedaleopsis nitida]